jgi:hypothetical protein
MTQKLSHPEQLDQVIPMLRLRDFWELVTMTVLLLLLISWSIFGRLPERIKGSGVLLADDHQLYAIVYLPVGEGKRVHPGMVVQVAPSTIKKEEYGMLKGRVTQIAAFTAELTTMAQMTGSQKLAELFASKGPVLQIRVDLETSTVTPSGYVWTGGRGPDNRDDFTAGTLIDSEVTVSWRRPIGYVIPWMRKTTGWGS